MAEESEAKTAPKPDVPAPAEAPTPKKSAARTRKPKVPAAEPTSGDAEEKKPEKSYPRAPRRPALDPEASRLLAVRRTLSDARPVFGRQAANRYFRIGRWGAWRRPRGLQSKQRRHYGYRPRIVRIGYGTPARTRGLTPSGFLPVLVRTPEEIERLDPVRDAAVIARTVGTRRRLVLEESARKRGVHVLNPIVREEGGT